MYAPYKNTFVARPACSVPGDPCGTDAECGPSCDHPGMNVRTTCTGPTYLKRRHLGVCYPAFARVGDACTVGEYPDCNNAPGVRPAAVPRDVPRLFCQPTLAVDARPNSAPSYAAPQVGRGYCQEL
jgi:hypothetical protein